MEILLTLILIIILASFAHEVWNDRRRKPKTRLPRFIVMNVPVGREKGYQFDDKDEWDNLRWYKPSDDEEDDGA